jgi:hypothetical protein
VRVFHLCVFPHIVGLFEEEADESFAIFGKPRFVQSKVSGLSEMSGSGRRAQQALLRTDIRNSNGGHSKKVLDRLSLF